jgi:S-methylmethionine-dependent homocysteine/selenocysteine methylase
MATIRILDGGMSRELVRLGAELRQPEWSAWALMHSPEIVGQVHREFIEAGADVITTNSYALVPFHIGEERFRAEGRHLLARAGTLAREAADEATGRGIKVAGCLPPVFGSYEPQLFERLRVQDYLSVFVEELSPFVDVWLGETLSLIEEAEAVRTAVAGRGKPYWVSFTLEDDAAALADHDPRLRSGETVAAAAQWVSSSGADALLFNCSRPEVMRNAVEVAARTLTSDASAIEIGVYANAFEDDGNESAANEQLHRTRQDLTGENYTRFAATWVEAGATLIGGCCGIGASHIACLKRTFDS